MNFGLLIGNDSVYRDKTITPFSVFPNIDIKPPNPRSSVLIARKFSVIILTRRPLLAPPKMIHSSNASKKPPKFFLTQ